MPAVADAKAFLRKTNADGVSVYSHLTEVLATLLDQKPDNALDALEGVSLACKQKHYIPALAVVPQPPPELGSVSHGEHWHMANVAILTPPKAGEEPAEQGVVTDVLSERALFECAGVGLSELETYRVYAGLLALQQAKKLSQVRFFGKVLGTGADYYVAEAKYESPPDPPEGDPPPPPPGAPVEESGTGSNEFVYFVANDPAAAWTVLPDVTPHAIVSSRPIYKFLTGNLSAEVRAYPPFPGKENEYLRALIARIVHGTTLTAVNKFKMPEEYEPGAMPAQNEDEDYKPTPTAKLGDVKGWCTRYYGLLQIGRTVNPPPPEEELAEGEVSKLPKPEPELKPLSPIDASAWMVTTYTHGGPAVAVARSLKWPGAYNAYQLVGKKDTVAQVYVGFGLEALDAPFKMQPPPPFQYEPAELEEQLDTPLDEENAAFVKLAMAALAEEAAAMPDPAE